MNVHRIREAIWNACVANKVPRLAYLIETQETRKITKSFGSAAYHKRIIFLSTKVFYEATDLEQYQALVHLTCHIVARFKYANEKVYRPIPTLHGVEWRQAMANARVPISSTRCFVPSSDRLSASYFSCRCEKKMQVDDYVARKMPNLVCRTCHDAPALCK